MGLLQELVGQFAGGGGQQCDQRTGDLMSSVAGLLNSPRIGGISGLAQMFQQQGLGHIIQGWIGNGPNPPISADQLQQVLGEQHIADIARKLGIDPDQAATQLASVLPHAVDHLTPNGQVPAPGSMGTEEMLGSLMKKFCS